MKRVICLLCSVPAKQKMNDSARRKGGGKLIRNDKGPRSLVPLILLLTCCQVCQARCVTDSPGDASRAPPSPAPRWQPSAPRVGGVGSLAVAASPPDPAGLPGPGDERRARLTCLCGSWAGRGGGPGRGLSRDRGEESAGTRLGSLGMSVTSEPRLPLLRNGGGLSLPGGAKRVLGGRRASDGVLTQCSLVLWEGRGCGWLPGGGPRKPGL